MNNKNIDNEIYKEKFKKYARNCYRSLNVRGQSKRES